MSTTSTESIVDNAEKGLELVLTLAGVGAIGVPLAKLLQAAIHAYLDKQGIPASPEVTAKSAAIDKLFTDAYAKAAAAIAAKYPHG